MKNVSALPKGTWLYFRDLPPGVTEDRLSDLLVSVGLNIGPENISVKRVRFMRGGECSSAIVSFTKENLLDIVNWVLNGSTMNGIPVVATCPPPGTPWSPYTPLTAQPEEPSATDAAWPPAGVQPKTA